MLPGNISELTNESFQNSHDPRIVGSGELQRESIEISGLEEFQSYVFLVSIATNEGKNPPGDDAKGCAMTVTDG